MINKDQDDVFSESQIDKLKVAFKELDLNLSLNSFDQTVQLKILRNRIQEISAKASKEEHHNLPHQLNLSSDSHVSRQNMRMQSYIDSLDNDNAKEKIYPTQVSNREVKFWNLQLAYNLLKKLMPIPTLAMTLAFVSGIAITSSYYVVVHQSINDDQTVRSSSTDEADLRFAPLALEVIVTAPNSIEKRSQIIESAMRAKLRVIVHVKDSSIVLSIDGLKESDPIQLAFKALAGLSPSQSGAVNLKFTK